MSFVELLQSVIKKGLCARCGMCVGVCPVKAIGLTEVAYPMLIDRFKECGLCTKYEDFQG